MSSSQGPINNLGYQVFMVGISLLALANAAVLIILNGHPLVGVPGLVDALLTPIFLVDFGLRVAAAKSKWRYFFVQSVGRTCWAACGCRGWTFCESSVFTASSLSPGRCRDPEADISWDVPASLANSVLGAMTLLAILVLEIGGIACLF